MTFGQYGGRVRSIFDFGQEYRYAEQRQATTSKENQDRHEGIGSEFIKVYDATHEVG